MEDVWALPVYGGAEDFQALLEVDDLLRPAGAESAAIRVLWVSATALAVGSASAGFRPRSTASDEAAGQLPIPGTKKRR